MPLAGPFELIGLQPAIVLAISCVLNGAAFAAGKKAEAGAPVSATLVSLPL